MEGGRKERNNRILVRWKLRLLLSWSVMFPWPRGAAELDQNQDQLLHLQPQPPSSYFRPHVVAQSGQ